MKLLSLCAFFLVCAFGLLGNVKLSYVHGEAMHVVGFFAISIALSLFFKKWLYFSLTLCFLTELLQMMLTNNRHFGIDDILMNLIGVFAFCQINKIKLNEKNKKRV